MNWLNYHHLLYFWMVAKEGSIVKACEKLHLTQPTVSVQLQTFENSIGHRLFKRVGRQLILTEMGQTVFQYADEIFKIGQNLNEILQSTDPLNRSHFKVGITDSLPKIVTFRILEFLRKKDKEFQLVCYEDDDFDGLLQRLSNFELDLVLADEPVNARHQIKAYNHLLGHSGCSFFGSSYFYNKCHQGFPQSLHGQPFLLPTQNTALRQALNQWFQTHDIVPHIIAEFDDMALLEVFGQEGAGIFCLPSAVEEDIEKKYQIKVLGKTDDIVSHFYAISIERKLKHPILLQLTELAHKTLFKTTLSTE